FSPGYCWPFQASQSQVHLQLPARVQLFAITVQHPLEKSSALGDISSAPRDFTVSVTAPLCFLSKGVDVEGEEETLLGTFRFDVEREPTQTFPLQNELARAFWAVRLRVHSNWGQPDYACIYRVQVHGR
ncbi:SPAG4 protein, partial [Pedionomus torquatus]|nr:SPAG4 protein [Pedionomus torquatus]